MAVVPRGPCGRRGLSARLELPESGGPRGRGTGVNWLENLAIRYSTPGYCPEIRKRV